MNKHFHTNVYTLKLNKCIPYTNTHTWSHQTHRYTHCHADKHSTHVRARTHTYRVAQSHGEIKQIKKHKVYREKKEIGGMTDIYNIWVGAF